MNAAAGTLTPVFLQECGEYHEYVARGCARTLCLPEYESVRHQRRRDVSSDGLLRSDTHRMMLVKSSSNAVKSFAVFALASTGG